jgi:hypothetical protein
VWNYSIFFVVALQRTKFLHFKHVT